MGYFQSVQNPENAEFRPGVQGKVRSDRVIGDTMEAAYISVYLWKLAVEKAKLEVDKVVAASSSLGWDAPEGDSSISTRAITTVETGADWRRAPMASSISCTSRR